MSTRLAKQIVYAAFYVIVWAAVVFVGYKLFIHQTPPPPPTPTQSATAINIGDVNAFTASAGQDTFLAKIVNPNTGYAAASFDYSFNVYNDATTTPLASYPGHSSLYAGQVKYLLLANQPIPTGVTRADLTITNVQWVDGTSFGTVPQLVTQNVTTQTNASSSSATIAAVGQLTNQDVMTFNNVLIIAIFKDSQGNPVGASQTVFDSIAPGQTKNFSITYPAIPGIKSTQTEVEPYAGR